MYPNSVLLGEVGWRRLLLLLLLLWSNGRVPANEVKELGVAVVLVLVMMMDDKGGLTFVMAEIEVLSLLLLSVINENVLCVHMM